MAYNAYQKAHRYLINLGSRLGTQNTSSKPLPHLERMKELLRRLNNPHTGMRYIHIAGTAGKGTTATLIHSCLNKNGIKAGLHTSPYVVSAIEKIKVGDLYISPYDFVKIVGKLKPHIEDMRHSSKWGCPSYFESFLAVAFVYFKEQGCEWVVLETGLGGMHDATNVVPHKSKLAVITNVGYDHMGILGYTLSDIARDKAGIIPQDGIVFTTEKRQHIRQIFKDVCRSKNARYEQVTGSDILTSNKILAHTVLRNINGNKKDSLCIKEFTDAVYLPARFEILQNSPKVIIDGAHNESKIGFVIERLKDLRYVKLLVIFATSDDKRYEGMLKQITKVAHKVICTEYTKSVRTVPAHQLKQCCKKIGVRKVEAIYHSHDAFKQALSEATDYDLILVTGSFYLVGEIRELYFPEQLILRHRRSWPKNP